MTTTRNAAFIGLKLENCCLGRQGAVNWGDFSRWWWEWAHFWVAGGESQSMINCKPCQWSLKRHFRQRIDTKIYNRELRHSFIGVFQKTNTGGSGCEDMEFEYEKWIWKQSGISRVPEVIKKKSSGISRGLGFSH